MDTVMLKVDLRTLNTGLHHVEFTPTAEDLGVEDPVFRDIQASADLTVDREQVVVRVKARAVATLVCDRTLVEFDQPIRGSYTACFMPREAMDPDAEDDDILPLEADQDELDLTDIVRDTLMLAVPVRKLAPGAEDLDIPTTFGEAAESEIDPRWKALEQLKSNPEESPE